jgi:long-chain acyl-CoA synthetase
VDLLTLRAAAGGGSIDGIKTASLVAAGFTLLQRSPALVRALAGRRAAILAPTSPQFLVALAASDGRGAVLVNPLAAGAEIAYQLQDANVGAVFTVSALAPRLPAGTVHVLLDEAPVAARVVAADASATRVDLGSHFGLELQGDADEPGRDEECAIVYTSAMAGRPLGAILTHRNLLANARAAMQAGQFGTGDHLLALLPFSHLFGLTTAGLAPLIAGVRVTTMARFNAIAAADRIVGDGVSILVGVPAIFSALLAAIERREVPFTAPALRMCICGGAPLAEELQARWTAATGVELRQGYGLTEASPVALFNGLPAENHRGALGAPFPGVRVSIRDPEWSTALPRGTKGEICIAGETVFRGYVSGGEDGLQVHEGWLHTGDLGVEDAAGVFWFRGLRKPMFTRNGFNVYPREVERVIGAMPGVRAVRVSGASDAAGEHEVAAEIVGDVSEAELKAWVEARLSAYKRPTRVTITPVA